MSAPTHKHFCHITVVVVEEEAALSVERRYGLQVIGIKLVMYLVDYAQLAVCFLGMPSSRKARAEMQA